MPAQATDNTTDDLDTRQLLRTLTAVKMGNFAVRMPDDQTGVLEK
jgi:hypothetical protein